MHHAFNLSISQDVQKLAEQILSKKEMMFAENIAKELLQNTHREHAIEVLRNIVGTKPKRPVYYLNLAIRRLPDETRNVVRYAGDFIDQALKHFAHEKRKYLLKSFALRRSLGPNLKKLKGVLQDDLIEKLRNFNDLIYVRAKHRWEVGSRPHLFSATEAVLVCFMVKKLVDDVVPFSVEVGLYLEGKMLNYHNTDPS